jgi:hypothetical protein
MCAAAVAGRDLAAVKVLVAGEPFAVPISRRFLEEVTPSRSVREAIDGRWQRRRAAGSSTSGTSPTCCSVTWRIWTRSRSR